MNKFKNYSRTLPWVMTLALSAMAAGCGGGGDGRGPILGADVAIFSAPAGAIVPGATCPVAGATVPTVTQTDPTNGNQSAATSTLGVTNSGKLITATFDLAMDATTIIPASFSLAKVGGALLTPASVGYNAATKVATLTTAAALSANTSYTAVIQSTAKSAAGTAIGCPFAWTFKTAAAAAAGPAAVNLGTAQRFGIFGGSAGMTNMGNLTVITGSNGNTADIGTTSTGTSTVTGFHDSAPSDIYTEVPGVNVGNVTGKIYTCTNSTTGPTSAVNIAPATANASSCTIATNARADTLAAYNFLVAQPGGPNPGAGNLANLTLAPGVYTAAAGSFKIEGGDLTLDAQGDVNAVWVFQMATTLTVGGPGVAFPQSIILAGGAQAKNVFWQVGTFATINAAGGGTMVGTIVSQSGASFSTVGKTNIVTLNGRALSLGASVTLVDTVINVPAP